MFHKSFGHPHSPNTPHTRQRPPRPATTAPRPERGMVMIALGDSPLHHAPMHAAPIPGSTARREKRGLATWWPLRIPRSTPSCTPPPPPERGAVTSAWGPPLHAPRARPPAPGSAAQAGWPGNSPAPGTSCTPHPPRRAQRGQRSADSAARTAQRGQRSAVAAGPGTPHSTHSVCTAPTPGTRRGSRSARDSRSMPPCTPLPPGSAAVASARGLLVPRIPCTPHSPREHGAVTVSPGTPHSTHPVCTAPTPGTRPVLVSPETPHPTHPVSAARTLGARARDRAVRRRGRRTHREVTRGVGGWNVGQAAVAILRRRARASRSIRRARSRPMP
ncbi:hypothetical protein HNP84_007995 [Thermocatellispora tengchongensis]|uniref:Uncharacterized protein n=1 Tax=Thermocatellispora tengchongensis TaxID=1073253 RepID=A0A840PGH0_9ACTN|nr:hypothetical protein [Thermocatellispora tengchongensis]